MIRVLATAQPNVLGLCWYIYKGVKNAHINTSAVSLLQESVFLVLEGGRAYTDYITCILWQQCLKCW